MVCQYQEHIFFFCLGLKKLKIWVEYLSENHKRLFLYWFCDSKNPSFLLSSPAGRVGHWSNKNVVLGGVTVFYHMEAVLCMLYLRLTNVSFLGEMFKLWVK